MAKRWKSPGAVTSIAATALTAVGLLIGYIEHQQGRNDRRAEFEADQKSELSEEKRQEELQELEGKIQNLTSQIQVLQMRIDEKLASPGPKVSFSTTSPSEYVNKVRPENVNEGNPTKHFGTGDSLQIVRYDFAPGNHYFFLPTNIFEEDFETLRLQLKGLVLQRDVLVSEKLALRKQAK